MEILQAFKEKRKVVLGDIWETFLQTAKDNIFWAGHLRCQIVGWLSPKAPSLAFLTQLTSWPALSMSVPRPEGIVRIWKGRKHGLSFWAHKMAHSPGSSKSPSPNERIKRTRHRAHSSLMPLNATMELGCIKAQQGRGDTTGEGTKEKEVICNFSLSSLHILN